jgi:hypothetical protein
MNPLFLGINSLKIKMTNIRPMSQEEILQSEFEILKSSETANQRANILFNIIKINISITNKTDHYKNIKSFIDNYVESIKSADYGYDNFNYGKIEQIIDSLSPDEQISMLQYMISITARELPEYDRGWFVTRKHKSEIKKILSDGNILFFPKAILLFFGQTISRLLIGLSILFLSTALFLMPAPSESFAVLNVTFEKYSENPFLNHILNVFSLFASLENDLVISPKNWFGLLLIVTGKFAFVVFIINFIYYKISDKISQK